MSEGTIVAICMASRKGEPMVSVGEAIAVVGEGLSGDRMRVAKEAGVEGKWVDGK
jgi:hypothetical protein